MLKFGNKEFRNLQEQVLKNMLDIKDIMQGATVLAEFGIKIIGQVDTAEELPDPATYEGEFGDAYIVGTEEPYEYYIFTRAFEGQDEPSWFDLGIFPVPGPQGETGPQGPQGPQGQTGNPGSPGASAGFGTVSATAQTLVPGSSATASVVASGPDNAKNFAFTFGIPQGGAGSGDVTDVEVNGVSVVDEDGVAEITIPAQIQANWAEDDSDDVSFIQNKPDLSVYAESADLGDCAYLDEDELSIAYNQITGTPTIPTDTSDLTNGAGFITSSDIPVTDVEVDGVSVLSGTVAEIDLSGYATTSDISDMATQTWVGQQGYLTSVSWSDVSNKPSFATVATSGDYDDLLNKPTIPAAQVNSDWNAASGVAQILNKPSLATVATSGSYADLSNKPTIPSVSGTYSGSDWTTITIDGTTKNISGGVTDVEVDNVSVVTSGVAELSTETWTFTLSDNTTVTKKVLVG